MWRPTPVTLLSYALASLLISATYCEAEECPPYLVSDGNGKELCTLASHGYLSGTWKRRGEECQVNADDLRAIGAYPYTWICHDNELGEPCLADAEVSGCQDRVAEIANWYWQPDECSLHPFSAEGLVDALAEKTLLIVGDSLGAQQFVSLKKLLEPYTIVPPDQDAIALADKWGPFYNKEEGSFNLRSGGQVTFMHHLYLVGDDYDSSWNENENSFQHVRWSLAAREADFVVFNTGHHWHKLDPDFVQYKAMANIVLEHIRRQHKAPYFMFRTTNLGHVVPWEFKEPYLGHQEYEPGLHPHFDLWMQVKKQERIWEDLIAQHGLTQRVKVLNISFTDMRADAHVMKRLVVFDQLKNASAPRPWYSDQLHYCLPGVPDYWNWLVYHAILTINAKLAELAFI